MLVPGCRVWEYLVWQTSLLVGPVSPVPTLSSLHFSAAAKDLPQPSDSLPPAQLPQSLCCLAGELSHAQKVCSVHFQQPRRAGNLTFSGDISSRQSGMSTPADLPLRRTIQGCVVHSSSEGAHGTEPHGPTVAARTRSFPPFSLSLAPRSNSCFLRSLPKNLPAAQPSSSASGNPN